MNSTLSLAKAALDAAHSADPRSEQGQPAELLYADRLETWLLRLIPSPSLPLSLAGRAQHLERWVIPRSDFPMDRPGYHAWRTSVHHRQGRRAEELLLSSGIEPSVAARVHSLVAKLSKDAEGQALEDAACLVFIEHELPHFAASHPDYTREKFILIIRRTWKKMSPAAHALAGTIPLPENLASLVQEAIS